MSFPPALLHDDHHEEPPPPYSETDFLDDYYFQEPVPPPIPQNTLLPSLLPRDNYHQSPNVALNPKPFQVPRKPLRSYQSTPEVNLLARAHQDGHQLHNTRQGRPNNNFRQTSAIHHNNESWRLQQQRQDGAIAVPPLPPRPSIYREEVSTIRTRSIEPNLLLRRGTPDDMFRRNTDKEKENKKEQIFENADSSSTTLVPSPNASTTTLTSNLSKLTIQNPLSRTKTSPASISLDEASPSSSKFRDGAMNAFRQTAELRDKILPHPVESSKHFSIVQHSTGVVWYQGTGTSFAMSIFATNPLPDDRSIWMQMRGWSGESGMRAKALLGKNGDWVDVTPSLRIETTSVDSQKEEKYQKDIARFRKRSAGQDREKHLLRETCIIRIPATVIDGYYQFLVCTGSKKKKLCTSPTFRLMSLSRNMHCLKGASVLTMPVEVATMMGTNAVKASAATVAATAVASVKVTQTAIKILTHPKVQRATTYMGTKAESKAGKATLALAQRAVALAEEAANKLENVEDVGEPFLIVGGYNISLYTGPTKPYPINLTARTHTDYTPQPEEFPDETFAIILSDVSTFAPNCIGSYFGWARFKANKKNEAPVDPSWQQIILHALPATASQIDRATISSVNKLVFSLQLLLEIDTSIPLSTSVELNLMGYLRSPPPKNPLAYTTSPDQIPGSIPELNFIDFGDRAMATRILEEVAWSSDAAATLLRGEKLKGFTRFAGALGDAKGMAMGQVSRIDLSTVGIRSDGDLARDSEVVVSGFYVKR